MKRIYIYIIITVIILAAGIGGILFVMNRSASHPVAYIQKGDEIIKVIDLAEVESEYSFDITDDEGGTNTVTVRPGEIAVTSANCPDKVCVHMGYIKNSSVPITCLPHKLVITIVDNGSDGPDSISQ